MVDMVQHQILNAVSSYLASLCDTILQKKHAIAGISCKVEEALATSINTLNERLMEETMSLKSTLETVPEHADAETLLHYYADTVFTRMKSVRAAADQLETLVASDYWPFPTYYDLLFSV